LKDGWIKNSAGDVSFTNTEIDGNITLDNQATFYHEKITWVSEHKAG
jgi:hypothetical protein